MVCLVRHQKQIAVSKTHSVEFCGGNAAISAKANDFAIFARPAAQGPPAPAPPCRQIGSGNKELLKKKP
jgi:hypothetical protein